MASRISNQALVDRVMRFITGDINDAELRFLVREAIRETDRSIHELDDLAPMAWNIVPYDELRTNWYANVSAVTAASPGVFTAQTLNDDITTGHGFSNHATITDIVILDNFAEMKRLNGRMFLLQYASSTTFTLKSLDGLTTIDTTNYETYSSGGVVYHAGFVLNTTTILANVSTEWTFKGVLCCPTFDGFPTNPISEQAVRNNRAWTDISYASRPKNFRYWQQLVTDDASPTINHYLFWYPPCDQGYNVMIPYEKEVADMSTFNTTTYCFHPAECHSAIWHGALALLVGESKRVKRTSDKVIATQLEVLFAQKWTALWLQDKARIINLSRKLMGSRGGMGGVSA